MTDEHWSQRDYGVRLEWGPVGAARLAEPEAVVVVVDVLCFTTCVSVAVGRGTAVRPAPWRGDRAQELAERLGADLADLPLATLKRFSPKIGADVKRVLTAQGSVAARRHPGGTAPAAVRKAIDRARKRLKR